MFVAVFFLEYGVEVTDEQGSIGETSRGLVRQDFGRIRERWDRLETDLFEGLLQFTT